MGTTKTSQTYRMKLRGIERGIQLIDTPGVLESGETGIEREKEAFVKAIGTGFRKNINFKDISISNNIYGKPQLTFNNKIRKLVKKKFKSNNFKIYLSLSDEESYSIAFVIIEKKNV